MYPGTAFRGKIGYPHRLFLYTSISHSTILQLEHHCNPVPLFGIGNGYIDLLKSRPALLPAMGFVPVLVSACDRLEAGAGAAEAECHSVIACT